MEYLVSDGDVKNILTELKNKIEKLKEQENWRKDQLKKMEEEKNNKEEPKEKDDDILSRISKQSGAQSISSQKTAERVQEL